MTPAAQADEVGEVVCEWVEFPFFPHDGECNESRDEWYPPEVERILCWHGVDQYCSPSGGGGDPLEILCNTVACEEPEVVLEPVGCVSSCNVPGQQLVMVQPVGVLDTPGVYLVRCSMPPLLFPFVTVQTEQSCPIGTYVDTVAVLVPEDAVEDYQIVSGEPLYHMGNCGMRVKALVLGFGHDEHIYEYPCLM